MKARWTDECWNAAKDGGTPEERTRRTDLFLTQLLSRFSFPESQQQRDNKETGLKVHTVLSSGLMITGHV